MMGRSGSPSRKLTITSCPTRGMAIEPQPWPAHSWETRTQQEQPFLRSQGNCTTTRPYLSTQISFELSSLELSSDAGFRYTTTALCGPCTKGLGVRRAGRKRTEAGMQVKWLE